MKAALFEKPNHLSVVDRPLRMLGKDEVLVRVRSCGVCGTDVHIVAGESRSTPPVVLGHEYSGVIEDVGSEVMRFTSGQHVAIDPNISCGTCYFCRRGEVHLCSNLRALGVDIDGGMAELCIVPEQQLYLLPKDFPATASAFIEPVSCVLHGIDRATIAVGDSVVIIGGGTIGLMMLQLCRAAGAAVTIVIEPLEQKRKIAQTLGATHVLDPNNVNVRDAVMDITAVGADVVIECAGRISTAEGTLDLARRGGTVEFFGVCPIGQTFPIEPNKVFFKELTIVGSYVNPLTFDRAIKSLAAGIIRVDEFPINRFTLDDVHEAIRYQKEGLTIKSIIEPNK
ncbi:MAG: zinc-dependent alcohol dehydrogenase family protein [Ignavibacteriales bacterium]|nr:zinc-dependent alcohol dehydrogenase family protein [Ignavibacteriales bacterium]